MPQHNCMLSSEDPRDTDHKFWSTKLRNRPMGGLLSLKEGGCGINYYGLNGIVLHLTACHGSRLGSWLYDAFPVEHLLDWYCVYGATG